MKIVFNILKPSSVKTNAVINYIQQLINKVEEAEMNECKTNGSFNKTDLYIRNDFSRNDETTLPNEGILIDAKEVRVGNEKPNIKSITHPLLCLSMFYQFPELNIIVLLLTNHVH